jgi:hypothetical protein
MNSRESRLFRRYSVLAAFLLPLFGCLISAAIIYSQFQGFPGALGRMSIDNLTRVVVPGSQEIYFSKKGAYAVYYEYRSVVNGVNYLTSKTPPALECELRSMTSSETASLAPDYVESNAYSTKDNERVGVLMMSISMDTPGTYEFSCRYPDGSQKPKVILAVGPNFVWEFFSAAAKPMAALLGGLIIFGGLSAIAAIILLFVYISARRRNSVPSKKL